MTVIRRLGHLRGLDEHFGFLDRLAWGLGVDDRLHLLHAVLARLAVDGAFDLLNGEGLVEILEHLLRCLLVRYDHLGRGNVANL